MEAKRRRGCIGLIPAIENGSYRFANPLDHAVALTAQKK